MLCREGPGESAWLSLSNGERAAVFLLAALQSDDTLYQILYTGAAQACVNGTYGAFDEVAKQELLSGSL